MFGLNKNQLKICQYLVEQEIEEVLDDPVILRDEFGFEISLELLQELKESLSQLTGKKYFR